jgi:hypothetical protein
LGGAAVVFGVALITPFSKDTADGLVQILPRCIRDNRTTLITFLPTSFAFAAVMPLIALKLLVVWDLIEDVLAYIANGPRRRMLIEALSQTISNVDDARAGVPLILIGHSLGSVLLAHSVPGLNVGASVLVTCGSPLELMAKAFPRVVSSSGSIATRILSSSGIRNWINLYRDADYVGRSLRVERFENFSEKSIGDGGHADYYSDQRFWRAVLDVVITKPGPSSITDAESLGVKEKGLEELSDLRRLEQFSPWIGLLAGTLVVFLMHDYVWTEGSLSLLCLFAPFVWSFLALSTVSLAMQCAIVVTIAIRRRRLGQLPLSDLRLWRGPLWVATLCSSIFPLLALALCLRFA